MLISAQPLHPARRYSGDERYDLGHERREPYGLCTEYERETEDHQRLEYYAAADGNGTGRAGALGREEVFGIDQVQRHGNE